MAFGAILKWDPQNIIFICAQPEIQPKGKFEARKAWQQGIVGQLPPKVAANIRQLASRLICQLPLISPLLQVG